MAIGQGNSTKIQTICQRKYESLTELIPEYDGTKVCKHGNKLSPRCPKKSFGYKAEMWKYTTQNILLRNYEMHTSDQQKIIHAAARTNGMVTIIYYKKLAKTKLDVQYKFFIIQFDFRIFMDFLQAWWQWTWILGFTQQQKKVSVWSRAAPTPAPVYNINFSKI